MFFNVWAYVGCGLTHAAESFRNNVELFKNDIGRMCHLLCFSGMDGKSPSFIYNWDIRRCVWRCDLVIAILDETSIGLGMEMGTQMEARGERVLALARKGQKVTDMALDPGTPGYKFRRYKDLRKDGLALAIAELRAIHEKRSHKLLFRMGPTRITQNGIVLSRAAE